MKRWIAMLLTVCMLISLCPVGVFAESATGGTEPAQTVQTEQSATGATGVEPAAAPENKEEPTPAPGGAENPPAAPAPEGNGNAPAESGGENAPAPEGNGNAPAENGGENAPTPEGGENAPAENGGENAPAPEGNGNVPADNGGATGATGEQNPQPEQKTCTCTELCAQDAPNHNCEVCKDGDATYCKGSLATLDDPVPLPDDQPVVAEPEEPVCTCTAHCTEGNVDQNCEVCTKDFSKCHVSETQPVVDTYEFYVDGTLQEDWTQNLRDGETLSVPGNPAKNGAVFQRWYKLDDAQNRITVESGAVSGVSGTTVKVYAEFAEFSYVLFMSKDGTAVVHTAQGSKGDTVGDGDRNAATEMVNLSLGPTQAVVGWSTNKDAAAADATISFAAGTVQVYPVIKNGYWVIFDSKGGNYVAPIFARDGEIVTLPTTATRSGYTFGGWYQGGQPVTQVSAAATLAAHWIAAANTEYTVIHWQENADDNEYSFKESETKTGTTGGQTAAQAKSYEGFTVQAIEQQTIAGDRSTIVNVYYKRNVYTITFHYYACGKAEHTHNILCGYGAWCGKHQHKHDNTCWGKDIIKAKHGANISEKWPTVNGSCTWSVNEKFTDGPWQTNIDTMPIGGANFYGPLIASSTVYAYYYVEALPGTSGQAYILHHRDSSAYNGGGLYVTDEDRYPITGFTYKSGPQNGESYIDAKFYYTRNSYDIVFINNGTTEKTRSMKFEQSLSGVSYEPNRPDGVPEGYVFDGWYDNKDGVGNAFVFDGKTMPAQNITLYAKWKAPEFTATVYLTVEIGGEKETLSVPYGSSLKNASGYAELMEKVRANNDGQEPSAWFSVDSDGGKKLFNPDTKLYGDVTLVPHFSGTVDTFKVTYIEKDTLDGPVDSNVYQSGSYATVLSPIHGNLRFLYWKDEAHNKIYKPGESMKMTGHVTLTACYTEAPARVELTYHNGTESYTENNIRSNTCATVKSAAVLGFTAPDGYVFVGWSATENGAATHFPGDAVYVPKDGADLYAVWTKRTDLSYTVRYLDKDTGASLSSEVTVPNQTFDTSVNAADHRIDIIGYKFDSAEPETLKIGAEGNVIKLYYVKDADQTKNTKYTVKYTINGVEQTEDGFEVTGTAWVNDNPAQIAIAEGGIPAPADKYEGYKLDPANETYPTAGTKVNSGSVYIVNYVKDDSQTQDTKYTVKYTINGVEQTADGFEVTGTAWVNDNPAQIAIAEGGIPAPADKYEGYKLDESNPAYPGAGTLVNSGSVYTVNYVKRTDLTYTVKYLWTDGMGSGTAIEGVQDKVVEDVTFGQEILEDPIEIPGYTPVETGKVERRMDKESLTIVIPYYKNVTLTAASDSVVYNGTTQTLSGYTSSEAKAEFEGITASGSGKDVGGYAVTFSGVSEREQKISKDGRYLLTGTEDGKLTITPAPLTVTTESDSKVYDGTALTAPGSITGLVNDETVTFTVTGSQTDVGSSKNTYSIDWGNTKSSNYTVVETLGTLTVTAQSITPPVNPDDPNGYLGVQVDSPADHVYDGAEHKWAPTVTDKDGNALTENEDYTVSYGKTDFTNVTGDITVTIQGIGNYTGTVTRSYKITPREAVITVNNGTKTAGRNDPAFTGTVTGLIGENDLGVVSYVRTNNAEAVGTYADVLTALYTENANYDVRVINGTFVITAANNPNPNPPQPNPNPPQPQPQPQPEPEPEVEPEAGPEVEPEVTPEEPQPAAPDVGPVEEIVDEETPLAMGGAWALVNLILTVLTVLGSILLLIGYIGKKQKEREDENGNVILNAEGEAETDDIKKKGGWRLASIIPAVAAVIAFILTENMRLPMVLVDKWTLLMVIIALVQLLIAYFSKKKTQEPEQPEQMVANA